MPLREEEAQERKGHCRGKPRRVSTRFGNGGGKLNRRRARVVLNPCARESKARTDGLSRAKLIS